MVKIRDLWLPAFAAVLLATPVAMAQEGEHGGGHPGGGESHGDHGGYHAGGDAHAGQSGYRGGDHGYGGGGYRGGDDHGDRGGGYHGGGFGGPVYHGYGRYAYGGYPGYAGPFAVGAILGYYEGRPYYCYHRRHFRWSPYAHRYVAVPNRFC